MWKKFKMPLSTQSIYANCRCQGLRTANHNIKKKNDIPKFCPVKHRARHWHQRQTQVFILLLLVIERKVGCGAVGKSFYLHSQYLLLLLRYTKMEMSFWRNFRHWLHRMFSYWCSVQPATESSSHAGIISCMCQANERRCYNVTSSLIGWAHSQNDPCSRPSYLYNGYPYTPKAVLYMETDPYSVSTWNCGTPRS